MRRFSEGDYRNLLDLQQWKILTVGVEGGISRKAAQRLHDWGLVKYVASEMLVSADITDKGIKVLSDARKAAIACIAEGL